MSASPHTDVTIVTRLRAAGCVFAEDEARLLTSSARTTADLTAMVDRRVAGLPLEYVLGWADFCGLRIIVEPGVFVPRRRTELLVREAIAAHRTLDPTGPAAVVDLCCGTGAVARALSARLDPIALYATDIDPSAARCARRNLPDAQVFQGDLYEPLPSTLRGGVDVLVANAPYVPTDAMRLMPPEARLHEPRVALDGGIDGLDVQRRVASDAVRWLRPGGYLLIETSVAQAPSTAGSFRRGGLSARVIHSEELGATVVVGRHTE